MSAWSISDVTHCEENSGLTPSEPFNWVRPTYINPIGINYSAFANENLQVAPSGRIVAGSG